MKAQVVHELGGVESLQLEDVDPPQCPAGFVRIAYWVNRSLSRSLRLDLNRSSDRLFGHCFARRLWLRRVRCRLLERAFRVVGRHL